MFDMTTPPPDEPHKPAGRLSLYSEQSAAENCFRLAEGPSLTKVCADPDMPSKSKVLRWLHQHAELREQYALAKQISLDDLADLALHEASHLENGSGLRAMCAFTV
jgi:hypothetical protein